MADDRNLSGLTAEVLWAGALLCILFLLVVIAASTGKTFAPERTVLSLAGPLEAYTAWTAAGIRGRVGVFFDPAFSMEATLYQSLRLRQAVAGRMPVVPGRENAFCLALYDGIIREARVVVPDVEWPSARSHLSKFSFIACGDEQCRFTVEGAPVTVQGLASFSPPGEQVLVYLEGPAMARYGEGRLEREVIGKADLSDMVVVSDGARPGVGSP